MYESWDPQLWRQRREDLEREAANARLAKALRRSRAKRPAALRWELERHYGRVSKLARNLRARHGIRPRNGKGDDMPYEAAEKVRSVVGGWPGVTVEPHARGAGLRFHYGRIELGHLHGDSFADLPFPKRVRDGLISAGLASVHTPLPNSGWVRRKVESPQDVEEIVELFRLNYERARDRDERRDLRAKAETQR